MSKKIELIEIGDRVSWIEQTARISKTRTQLTTRTRFGRVQAFEGDVVLVDPGRKKSPLQIHITRLSKA